MSATGWHASLASFLRLMRPYAMLTSRLVPTCLPITATIHGNCRYREPLLLINRERCAWHLSIQTTRIVSIHLLSSHNSKNSETEGKETFMRAVHIISLIARIALIITMVLGLLFWIAQVFAWGGLLVFL